MVALTTWCASSCTAVQPECPREWFELGGGVFSHELGQSGLVDDASGFAVNGGYDFNADAVRASLEMGVAWSQNQVAGDSAYHDITRWSTGVRLTTKFDDLPLGAYVRGGWFWRDDYAHDSSVAIDDFWGNYFGAGMEWWYLPSATLGPFVMVLHGYDGGFEETFVGLAARFYVGAYD
jgi:hypothetical protein